MPGGSSSSAECVYQASAPSRSKNGSTWRSAVIVVQLLAARVAIKNDQRHAPEALPRNAPVRPVGDHVVHALVAPFRHPFHFVDFRERRLPQRRRFRSGHVGAAVVQLNEPLLGGAEDHRIVAAPAVRIAVREFSARRRACRDSSECTMTIGLASKTVLPLYSGKPSDEAAVVVLRRVGFQAVLLAGAEVVRAMAGRGVHDAAALLERDVIARARRARRSPETDAEIGSPRDLAGVPCAVRTANLDAQLRGDGGKRSSASSNFPAEVSASTYSKSGMERQRAVGWQRPRSRRPDQRIRIGRHICSAFDLSPGISGNFTQIEGLV